MVTKRSRIDTSEVPSNRGGGRPPASQMLLDLATLHAEAGSSLQAALAFSAGSTDAGVQTYHSALLGTLPALERAAEALQRAVDSRPAASSGQGASAAPGTGVSYPPSPPFTASTALRSTTMLQEEMAEISTSRVPTDRRSPYVCDRYTFLACICFPVLFGQLWQRHTRTAHSCTLVTALSSFMIFIMAWLCIAPVRVAIGGQMESQLLQGLDAQSYARSYQPEYRSLLPHQVRDV